MLAASRLPHALLLRGPAGLGKERFAHRLASHLLCEDSGARTDACGACRGCRLQRVGNHPDFLTLAPEEERTAILVSQVREIVSDLTLTSQYGGYKVVLVAPAERLNRSAVNTLLKTLEEPPGATVFVLVSHASALLPATVRSRCQTIEFRTPPPDVAAGWLRECAPGHADPLTLLRLAHGAPLRALALGDTDFTGVRDRLVEDLRALVEGRLDPVSAAEHWEEAGSGAVIDGMDAVIADLVKLALAGEHARMTHERHREALQGMLRGLDSRSLFRLSDRMLERRRAMAAQVRLNDSLTLEDAAIAWRRAARA